MAMTTLRVRARGNILVQNLEALTANPRRFIGREWVTVDGQAGAKALETDVEIPSRAEYRQAVQEGALWAADEATASECGVAFDSSFGAPHDS